MIKLSSKFLNTTVAIILAMSTLFVSCKDDDETYGEIDIQAEALFFSTESQTKETTYSANNVIDITVGTTPTGWEAVVDTQTQTITVTSPDSFTGDNEASGSIQLSLTSTDNLVSSEYLYVSKSEKDDRTNLRANSYLINKPSVEVTLDLRYKGESNEPTNIVSAEVLWQTKYDMIKYFSYDNGIVSFFISHDSDNNTLIDSGNAMIVGYDQDDNIVWSWHVWASDYDSETSTMTMADGSVMMTRNLGATANGYSTTDDILGSYGMYYQWGRKDPFVGPMLYNASSEYGSGSPDMVAYSGTGSTIYIDYEEYANTMAYATANPHNYLKATSVSDQNWSTDANQANFWGTTKTVNDPCPKGWMVAPKAAFSNLAIKDDLTLEITEARDKYENQFGWTLQNATAEDFFLAGGRRRYDNGQILNIYNPVTRNNALEAQPWEGYYWSSEIAAGDKSSAMYFFFDKLAPTNSTIDTNAEVGRANALQVRCVKAN